MTNKAFFSMTAQQYEFQRLARKVASLESGAEIVKLKNEKTNLLNYYEKNIKKLKKELELSHAETAKVCRIWFEVFEDLEAEKQKITEQMEKKIRELEKKILKWHVRGMKLLINFVKARRLNTRQKLHYRRHRIK